MAADFDKRQRQVRAEFRQGKLFAWRRCRRHGVGDRNVGLPVACQRVFPLQTLFFVQRARWRARVAHDDFERVVIAGLVDGTQFGDLRPLPLTKPATVFVVGGKALFVADEDGRVPEEANQAFVEDERERQGVHKRIPGEPGAVAEKRLQQRDAVGIAEWRGDEPGEQAVRAEGVKTPPDESVGGLAVGGKQRAGHGWRGWWRWAQYNAAPLFRQPS